VAALIVSYVARAGNRVRWLAGGCVMAALGHIIIALPHFATDHTSIQFYNETAFKQVFAPPDYLLRHNVTPGRIHSKRV
jgi:hypothetical protein